MSKKDLPSSTPLIVDWEVIAEYPYEPTFNLLTKNNDVYNRNVAWLLSSLALYAERLTRNEIILDGQFSSVDLQRIIRICRNQLNVEDFIYLVSRPIFKTTKNSIIFGPRFLETKVIQLVRSPPALKNHQQSIFTYHEPPNKFCILLVPVMTGTIEAYLIGISEFDEIKSFVFDVVKLLSAVLPHAQYHFQVRLQLTLTDPSDDPIATALYITYYLHRHGNYLDTSLNRVLKLKALILRVFRLSHDDWLGNLQMETVTPQSHPFLYDETNTPPDATTIPQEPPDWLPDPTDPDGRTSLRNLGWAIIDNIGDGNCGYYSLLFGLENNGITEWPVDDSIPESFVPLQNSPWQSKVVSFRKRLSRHSQRLLTNIYPEGNRAHEWWWRLEESNEDEMNLSSDPDVDCLTFGFWDAELDEDQYFSNLDTAFHMKPYWGCFLVASLFKMRVILIIQTKGSKHNKEKDKKQETHSWATVDFRYNSSTDTTDRPHLLVTIHEEQIVRLPDLEFKTLPTIELLFINGFDPNGDEINQHFLFLRRIVCDTSPPSPNDSSHLTLKTFMRQQAANQKQGTKRKQVANILQGRPQPQPDTHDPATQMVRPQPQPDKHDTPTKQVADILQTLGNLPPANDVDNARPPKETLPPANDIETITPVNAIETIPPANDIETIPPANEVNKASPPKETILGPRAMPIVGKKKTLPAKKGTKKSAHYLSIQISRTFSRAMRDGTFTPKVLSKMKYDSKIGKYFSFSVHPKTGRIQQPVEVNDLEEHEPMLLEIAKENPDIWVGPPLGDPGDDEAPIILCTKIKTIYQQHERPFCLPYSLASALFYCGFKVAASELAAQAGIISRMLFDDGLEAIKQYMRHHVPEIGLPTLYRTKTKTHNRTKRELTWEDICSILVPHPTIVIPVTPEGGMTHAFCVVDDLIFDASTSHALKLQMESVNWIFHNVHVEVYQALRFNMKISPPGVHIDTYYRRPVTLHWNHPGRPTVANKREALIQSHKQCLYRKVPVEGTDRKKPKTIFQPINT